jgi:hypothetical protein
MDVVVVIEVPSSRTFRSGRRGDLTGRAISRTLHGTMASRMLDDVGG